MRHVGTEKFNESMGVCVLFFFQEEDGIRDAQESRGRGDVYKRQVYEAVEGPLDKGGCLLGKPACDGGECILCLLYTSDAADDLLCVDLGGRRIIHNYNP